MTELEAAERLIAAHPTRAEPRRAWPCCTFVGLVVLEAVGLPHAGLFGPGSQWWRRMNVTDPARPFSSVDAAREAAEEGLGTTIPATVTGLDLDTQAMGRLVEQITQIRGVWAVQGWRRLKDNGHADPADIGSGHTFLVRTTGRGLGLVLESSVKRGVRLGGVAWRGGDAPQAQPLTARLAPYTAGIGATLLWREV